MMLKSSRNELTLTISLIVIFWCLFVFTQTSLQLFVMGAAVLFFFLHCKKLQLKKVDQHPLIFFSWIGIFAAVAISTLFTHNLPLTLQFVTSLLFGYLIFCFFFFVDEAKLSNQSIVLAAVGVIASVSVVNLLILAFPQLATNLPTTTVLFNSFGHGHVGALLLLAIPVVGFYLSQPKHSLLAKGVLILLLLTLLLSRGRVTILLGMVELATLFFIQRKAHDPSLKKFLTGTLLLVIGAGVLQISYISLIERLPQTDVRPVYWQQALRTAQEYPLVGYGPGTFALASKKYREVPWEFTSYAHNLYLQWLAEMGVLGMLAMTLFSSLMIWAAIKTLKDDSSRLEYFLAVGLISSILNGLLDFDWQISGTFFLILVWFAVVLKRLPGRELVFTRHVRMNKIIDKSMMATGAGILIVCMLALIVEYQLFADKPDEAITLFPTSIDHQEQFAERSFNQSSFSALKAIYFHDSDYMLKLYFFGKAFPSALSLFQDDRWILLTNPAGIDLIVQSRDEFTDDQKRALVEFVRRSEDQHQYILDQERKKQLSEVYFYWAESAFAKQQYELAGDLYAAASWLDHGIFVRLAPLFLRAQINDQVLISIINKQEIYFEGFFDYEPSITDELVKKLQTIENPDPKLIEQMRKLAPWLQ